MKAFVAGCIVFLLQAWTLPAQSAAGAAALQNYTNGRNAEMRAGLGTESNAYYNEAIRLAEAEIRSGTATLDSYAALVNSLYRLQRHSEAVRRGNEGLRLGVDYRIIETMGEAYFYIPDYDSSMEYMERYVAAYPQGDRAAMAFFFMGEIYRLRGQNHHADMAYTTSIRLGGNNALWWYRLGQVREAAGEKNAAIEAYRRTLSIDPSFRDTAARLASLQAG
jgi:tetratricopeptide (TPR) repeat protein